MTPRGYDPKPHAFAHTGSTAYDGTTYYKETWALDPAKRPERFGSYNEAYRVAKQRTLDEWEKGTTGSMLRKHRPPVEAYAIVQAQRGVDLIQTNARIDDWDEYTGYIFKRWTKRSGDDIGRALDPKLLALVSHHSKFDFRGTDGDVIKRSRS